MRLNTDNLPLVSCIMPTHNRRAFVPQAIYCFLRQNKELVIVDDRTGSVKDLVPANERFRYIRLGEKNTVGGKRIYLVSKDVP